MSFGYKTMLKLGGKKWSLKNKVKQISLSNTKVFIFTYHTKSTNLSKNY